MAGGSETEPAGTGVRSCRCRQRGWPRAQGGDRKEVGVGTNANRKCSECRREPPSAAPIPNSPAPQALGTSASGREQEAPRLWGPWWETPRLEDRGQSPTKTAGEGYHLLPHRVLGTLSLKEEEVSWGSAGKHPSALPAGQAAVTPASRTNPAPKDEQTGRPKGARPRGRAVSGIRGEWPVPQGALGGRHMGGPGCSGGRGRAHTPSQADGCLPPRSG